MFLAEIKWLLGVVLVLIVLALGVMWLKPGRLFGKLFSSTKVTIAETPLSVREIRDIGELITAEYYGEVIHPMIRGKQEQARDVGELEAYYTNLQNRLKALFDENNVATGIFRKTIKPEKTWQEIMSVLRSDDLRKSDNFELVKEVAGMTFEDDKAFCQLVIDLEWNDFLRDPLRASRMNQALSPKTRGLQTREELQYKLELAYLGRGWVKAGYQLSGLQAEQIERRNDTLIIHNMNPEILNADINPWFIPPSKHYKNGSPGFELLRARIDDKDVDKLESAEGQNRDKKRIPFWAIDEAKAETKKKLLRAALDRHILDSARVSAERTLLTLFQLVDPDSVSQIHVVQLQAHPLFALGLEVMDSTYCLNSEDVKKLKERYAADTEASENEPELAAVRKAQWLAIIRKLDRYLLCRQNDVEWDRWKLDLMQLPG